MIKFTLDQQQSSKEDKKEGNTLMQNIIQAVRQFFKNPYFSTVGWFLTSLAWFISFAFFERRIVYLIIGIITFLFGLIFLDQASHHIR